MNWFNYWIIFMLMSVPPWGIWFGLAGLTVQIVGLIGFILIILDVI